ncbi:DUF3040 domain-containing protein [Actinomadura darangshiensis]|uniref:DUF3040 domain-containing protein n=1 Tax=Actinomadura darangshiensis TaxID=705336 RepID=A0A4V6PEE0_9ACTN|nr:DUF3040 domain-containing protein [Actinomadura darangshiensis]TDD66007.1 DUF3040 domain-containing protein [Actinomadura darangshiensis]
MSLPLHESRVLALIEMGLCREDRELAARFTMFNRLAAAETPPRREHLEPSRRLCWVLTAVLVLSIVALGAIAAAVSG